MNKITDTSALSQETHLSGALLMGQTGYIENMEASGQLEFLKADALPRECVGGQEAFEALGFVFGEPIDYVFCNGTLPEGWTKEKTDHHMWTSIMDETGTKRVAVFYKAAFYDRRAFMRFDGEEYWS